MLFLPLKQTMNKMEGVAMIDPKIVDLGTRIGEGKLFDQIE